jgi:hypothetical protein
MQLRYGLKQSKRLEQFPNLVKHPRVAGLIPALGSKNKVNFSAFPPTHGFAIDLAPNFQPVLSSLLRLIDLLPVIVP